jgi:predicted RNA-binding protein with PIN domain
MALLIDGYNLLHATNIFGDAGPGSDLHRSRLALLRFLAASITDRERRETTIVFDASGAPPGLPRVMEFERMQVRFAQRHSDADELIEELLEQHAAPRSLRVVSSDHRVQRAARRRGADYVDSSTWYGELRATQREEDQRIGSPAIREAGMSAEELAYWLNEFDGPGGDDDNTNPFPPGYAEDVTEEECD